MKIIKMTLWILLFLLVTVLCALSQVFIMVESLETEYPLIISIIVFLVAAFVVGFTLDLIIKKINNLWKNE